MTEDEVIFLIYRVMGSLRDELMSEMVVLERRIEELERMLDNE